jgi:transposase
MQAKPEVIELDMRKLEALLERIHAGLGEEVAAPFRELLHSYAYLLEIIQNNQISLGKLQQLLFGASTERSRNVLGTDGGSSAERVGSSQETEAAEGTSLGEGNGEGNGCGRRRRRKGHGRNGAEAYTGCPKIVVPHPWLSAGDGCPECGDGKVYLQVTPKSLVRLVGQAPVGGTVYELQRLRCHLCGDVFTAEPPPEAGPEKYDATAVSMMALLRYGYGMPLNRMASLQEATGIPLPASTQWELTSGAADRIEPVFEHLILQGAQGDLVHNDDTPMRILELMNEKTRRHALSDADPDRRGIFTSNILSISEGHSIALFFTGTRHAGENLRAVLARRAKELQPPIQMCDALSRNMPEDLRVIVANCLSHGRRRFVEVVQAFPEQVAHVLESLKHVYKVDAKAKKEKLSPQERLRLHQESSGPVMEELEKWLKEQLEHKKVEPNSGLGQAVAYMLKHWAKLTLFLRQPGAPLDNNICEHALKKAIRHRKNSLFYKTQRGAHVGDLYMSLIHTCYLCDADPFDYLTQLLRNHEKAARTPGEWMPWNYQTQPVLARASPSPSLATTGSSDETELSESPSSIPP